MTDPWNKSFRVFAGLLALLAGGSAGIGTLGQEDIKTLTEAISAIAGACSALLAVYSKYREGKK